MNRKKMSLALMSLVAVSLIVSFATADGLMAHTPLYSLRMEQQSSQMNFLPTAVNSFVYATQHGYTLTCCARACGGVIPLGTDATCFHTCLGSCPVTCETCQGTCGSTCSSTCLSTCSSTCPLTCWETCNGPTCSTCRPECPPTSYDTCGIDCKETVDPACPP